MLSSTCILYVDILSDVSRNGVQFAPLDLYAGGRNEIHDFDCNIRSSSVHLPILRRLRDPNHQELDSCCVDPYRWLAMAKDLQLLEHSSDTFHYDACQLVFNMMQDALTPIHTVGAVTNLLNSYNRMLTIAVSHDEGVQVAKNFLGASLQLKVIQQVAASWDVCIACSISDVHRKAVPHGLRQDGRQGPLLVQNSWLPVRMTAWGKVYTHLDLARNLLSLANLAMMSEQTSVTRAAGSVHLRREPSFAQLAGANAKSTVCPRSYRWFCLAGLCLDALAWMALHCLDWDTVPAIACASDSCKDTSNSNAADRQLDPSSISPRRPESVQRCIASSWVAAFEN